MVGFVAFDITVLAHFAVDLVVASDTIGANFFAGALLWNGKRLIVEDQRKLNGIIGGFACLVQKL